MGRLIASVREAEERLAGLARALQSAWEEEVAEASSAREAARRSLLKADAMAEAAGSLGREELASRLIAVAQQLRAVEERASGRLEALMRTERDLQLRLESSGARPPLAAPALEAGAVLSRESTPPAVEPPLPPQPSAHEADEPAGSSPPEETSPPEEPATVEVAESVEEPAPVEEPATIEAPAPAEAPATAEQPRAVPAGEPEAPEPEVEVEEAAEIEIVSDEDDAAEEVVLEVEAEITAPPAPVVEVAPAPTVAPAQGLARRVEEFERVAERLPLSVLEPALEELVALTRLMTKGADPARADQAARLRERLRVVATRRGRERTFGLSDDEFADWASLAMQARARRQEEVDRVKASRRRPQG